MKMQKSVAFVKKKIENKYLTDKKYCKVRDHFHYTRQYRGVAHSICNLKYGALKKIPIVTHNGSNYYHHCIVKELAEEFLKNFLFRRKHWKIHTNQYKKNKKKLQQKKKLQELIEMKKKNISYILQFINSERFMASSLSNLINNLSEVIHRIQCKYGHDNKKCETCGSKYK